jgi:hypothetical protein
MPRPTLEQLRAVQQLPRSVFAPQKGRIEPPKEVKEILAAKPSDSLRVPNVDVKIRRVVETDLDELIPPSIPLFQKRWPNLTAETTYVFCRSLISTNQALLIRTDNAWGAATVARPFFEPQGIVSERWVASIRPAAKGLSSEPLAIYHAIRDWAKAIGAAEWAFGESTGADLSVVAKEMGFPLDERGRPKFHKVFGQRLK